MNRLKASGWRGVTTTVMLVVAVAATASGCSAKSIAPEPTGNRGGEATSSAAPRAASDPGSNAATGDVVRSELWKAAYDGYLIAGYPEKQVPIIEGTAVIASSICYEKQWVVFGARGGTVTFGPDTRFEVVYNTKADPSDVLGSYAKLMADAEQNTDGTIVSGHIGDLFVHASYAQSKGYGQMCVDVLPANPRPADLDRYFASFPSDAVQIMPGTDPTYRSLYVDKDLDPGSWTRIWAIRDVSQDGKKAMAFYRKNKGTSYGASDQWHWETGGYKMDLTTSDPFTGDSHFSALIVKAPLR